MRILFERVMYADLEVLISFVQILGNSYLDFIRSRRFLSCSAI